MVETEHWELLNLIDRIDEYKQELVRDEAEARKPLRVFRRLTNPYLGECRHAAVFVGNVDRDADCPPHS